MSRRTTRARGALFAAAVMTALGFGAHAALADAPGTGGRTITCTWKTSTQAGCYNTCATRGTYYYMWYPSTQQCCCSTIAP